MMQESESDFLMENYITWFEELFKYRGQIEDWEMDINDARITADATFFLSSYFLFR